MFFFKKTITTPANILSNTLNIYRNNGVNPSKISVECIIINYDPRKKRKPDVIERLRSP